MKTKFQTADIGALSASAYVRTIMGRRCRSAVTARAETELRIRRVGRIPVPVEGWIVGIRYWREGVVEYPHGKDFPGQLTQIKTVPVVLVARDPRHDPIAVLLEDLEIEEAP